MGTIINNYDKNLYKQLNRNYPLVNGFVSISFIFSSSEDIRIQKVKNTGKLLYAVLFILFISSLVVMFLS